MAAQMVAALPHASAVVDEPAHLTAGCLLLARGDLLVNREHPPLVKALAAAPVLAMEPALPPEPAGLASHATHASHATEDFEFAYSREFLYRANDADRLLRRARLPIIGLTLAAGLALYAWARALAGPGAALAALALYAFEPNLLAHGRLVTTDLAAAAFSLAALGCLERSAAAGGRRGMMAALASGLCLGLGLLSRFSCLLLIPLMAAGLALDRRSPSRQRARRLAAAVGVALLVVNIAYGLAGASGIAGFPFPLAARPQGGPLLSQPLAWLEAGSLSRWLPLPLPRIYVEGLDLARHKNLTVEGPGYLNGEISARGWPTYFVQALAMKTTLPWMLLALCGLAACLARPSARPVLIWGLLPAAGFIALVTATTRAQIGLRYVLPSIPLLCLVAGMAASEIWKPGRAARVAVVALSLWHAAEALMIHPYHLAYFNEAAGGPRGGYRRLVDSNLDWGQDLVGLRRFMSERGLDSINLYYFGTADPDYYGIRRPARPEPGYFAVSATHLMGVYLPDPGWLAPFREIPPEATIGHSIFVYRLDQVPEFLTRPIRRK